MTRSKFESPADLPQAPETWHLGIRQLDVEMESEDGELVSPFIALIADIEAQLVFGMEISPSSPGAGELEKLLLKTMLEPMEELGMEPKRPQSVLFEDPDLLKALTPALEELGITTDQSPHQDEFDWMAESFAELMGGERLDIPGLLAVEGATPELVADLFAAAADYYRAKPWELLADIQPLALRFDPPGVDGFMQLMGNAGMEFGLMLYWDWDDVLHTYKPTLDPLSQIPASGWRSFTFESLEIIPFEDLGAIHLHKWDLAGEHAVPMPVYYTHNSTGRPPREELIFFEAALRAIPLFAAGHLEPDGMGDYLPAEAVLNISTHDGPMTVTVKYPAGELPDFNRGFTIQFENDGSELLDVDDANGVDPDGSHAVESELSESLQLLGGSSADSLLVEAQELVYQAWEERDPTRRVRLARQVLEMSPDCADAYILLAEDLADTVQEAYKYYQQGVQAGERALGEDFFKEAVGHFWGILETRPYMRARSGLAECLASMDRQPEALVIYRDMLRLNPGDNQGIRYVLLALLMEMDLDQDAWELLDQYPEDSFAGWTYSRALLLYKRDGPSPGANAALDEAVKLNPHVPELLSGKKSLPPELPPYMGSGDDTDAFHYAAEQSVDWRRTPGAIKWLKERTGQN